MNLGMYGIQEEEMKDKKETKGVRSESRHSSLQGRRGCLGGKTFSLNRDRDGGEGDPSKRKEVFDFDRETDEKREETKM